MPTTIYDLSLITIRKRDKAIAQKVQQRNTIGDAIISPQAGYASYTIPEVNQGTISYFRKAQGCTVLNLPCSCNNAIQELIEEDGILLYTFLSYNSSVTV